jgi:hypothetical protein
MNQPPAEPCNENLRWSDLRLDVCSGTREGGTAAESCEFSPTAAQGLVHVIKHRPCRGSLLIWPVFQQDIYLAACSFLTEHLDTSTR